MSFPFKVCRIARVACALGLSLYFNSSAFGEGNAGALVTSAIACVPQLDPLFPDRNAHAYASINLLNVGEGSSVLVLTATDALTDVVPVVIAQKLKEVAVPGDPVPIYAEIEVTELSIDEATRARLSLPAVLDLYEGGVLVRGDVYSCRNQESM